MLAQAAYRWRIGAKRRRSGGLTRITNHKWRVDSVLPRGKSRREPRDPRVAGVGAGTGRAGRRGRARRTGQHRLQSRGLERVQAGKGGRGGRRAATRRRRRGPGGSLRAEGAEAGGGGVGREAGRPVHLLAVEGRVVRRRGGVHEGGGGGRGGCSAGWVPRRYRRRCRRRLSCGEILDYYCILPQNRNESNSTNSLKNVALSCRGKIITQPKRSLSEKLCKKTVKRHKKGVQA